MSTAPNRQFCVILYDFSFFTTKFYFAEKSGQLYAGCINPFYVLCQQ